MVCPVCGREYEGENCPLCAALSADRRITDALGSVGFLILSILVSVAAAINFLLRQWIVAAFLLLAVLSLWLLYADGKNPGFFSCGHLKPLSGLLFLTELGFFVAAGWLAFSGVTDSSWEAEQLTAAGMPTTTGEMVTETLLLAGLAALYGVMFLFIHRFVKSIVKSDEYYQPAFAFPRAAALCLVLLGILRGIALDFFSTAAGLLGAWIVWKYFGKMKQKKHPQ